MKFLDDLASDSPTPGGGSASALIGAISSALISMALRISIKKGKDIEKSDILKVKDLQKRLTNLIVEDSKAFENVLLAYREKNNEKIEIALKNAVEIPMEIATTSSQVLEIADKTRPRISTRVSSDFECGVLSAITAIKCAILNIEINLKYITDKEWKLKIIKDINNIKSKLESSMSRLQSYS
jgi:formiminotetrahydrofolate cyclodeaminase